MIKSPKNAADKEAQDDRSREDMEQITSLCLSEPEDQIYTINRNNQLQTIKFSYDRDASSEVLKLKPLHTAFHTSAITGMDICLRKQLIVTTSNR